MGAFLRVTEAGICFVDLFKFFFRSLFTLISVRVMLQSELPERLFHVFLGGLPAYAQDFIIILHLFLFLSTSSNSASTTSSSGAFAFVPPPSDPGSLPGCPWADLYICSAILWDALVSSSTAACISETFVPVSLARLHFSRAASMSFFSDSETLSPYSLSDFSTE